MTQHTMPYNDAQTPALWIGQIIDHLTDFSAYKRRMCAQVPIFALLTFAFSVLSDTVGAQPTAPPKPSQGNVSYIHRASAGDTAESIAFELLAKAADKSAREQFYAHNQVQTKNARKPVAANQPFNLPVAWMYQKPVLATVLRASGQAQMSHANTQNVFVNLGAADKAIGEGTTIKTGDHSFVSLRFPDNSVLAVAPNSEVLLESLRQYAGSDIFKIKVMLNQGRVESEVKPLAHQASDYSVRSRRLTTGVRGTQFSVSDDPNSNALAEVLQGSVALSDKTDKSLLVPRGFGSFVEQERASPLIPLIHAPTWHCDSEGASVNKALPVTFSQKPALYRLDIVSNTADQQQRLQDSTRLPDNLPEGDYQINVRGVDTNGLQGYGASSAVRVRAVTTPSFLQWVSRDNNQVWVLQETAASTSTRYFCESS
jgi:ferric-dicitrate binding protein FerR (iron transport regulator)